MKFYTGIHEVRSAGSVKAAFISINRLRRRRLPVPSSDWILDSGAFSELSQFGCYRHSPEKYAADVNRIVALNSGLQAAVTQDYMCEPIMLNRTGMTIGQHQQSTIERYDALLPKVNCYLMPVLQGYAAADYVAHLRQYGTRLKPGHYVGVGTVCKRNTSPFEVEAVLRAIKRERPDLRLHGFGIKITSLGHAIIRDALYSADSMAWSFAERMRGGKSWDNDAAIRFTRRVERMPIQYGWEF